MILDQVENDSIFYFLTNTLFRYNIVITMQQKIIQIGNSLGLIIPRALTEELNLQIGDKITMEKKEKKLIITPVVADLAEGVDPEFMKVVKDFMVEHDDVLRALAKR